MHEIIDINGTRPQEKRWGKSVVEIIDDLQKELDKVDYLIETEKEKPGGRHTD